MLESVTNRFMRRIHEEPSSYKCRKTAAHHGVHTPEGTPQMNADPEPNKRMLDVAERQFVLESMDEFVSLFPFHADLFDTFERQNRVDSCPRY